MISRYGWYGTSNWKSNLNRDTSFKPNDVNHFRAEYETTECSIEYPKPVMNIVSNTSDSMVAGPLILFLYVIIIHQLCDVHVQMAEGKGGIGFKQQAHSL